MNKSGGLRESYREKNRNKHNENVFFRYTEALCNYFHGPLSLLLVV